MVIDKKWIIIIICVLVSIGLSRSLWDTWNRRDIVAIRKLKYDELKKKNDELKKRLELVHTTEFVEQEARDRLGMAKEGETIIMIKSTQDKNNSEKGEENVYLFEPNWKRWWQMFF